MQFLHEIQHIWTYAGSNKRPAFAAGRGHQVCVPWVQVPSKETMVRGQIAPAGGSSHGFFSTY